MTIYQWLIFFLLIQIVHFVGTWKLYEKAGRKSWEALVPVYNAIVLMKIINRPTWYTFLLFVPVINLIMFPVVWVETLRSFGKNTTLDTFLGIATFGLYIYYINYTQNVTYIKERSLTATTKVGDTVSSLLFAVVVATFVHTYFIQPFTIPTPSLEKSLLVGDFLFVSKFHYGARTPMTPIAAPMVHDTLPLLKVKSYSIWPQLPYFRFPALEKIKNNDIVVFNWPADTLFNMYKETKIRYDKPIDKKTNYVKRCVGIAGDSLQIKNGDVFINGKKLILPERAKPQFFYTVKVKQAFEYTQSITEDPFLQKYDIKIENDFDWQKQHFKSLEAAYRSSPFFEYFEDEMMPIFTKKHIFLLDLNFETIDFVLKCLRLNKEYQKTIEYFHEVKTTDYRYLANGKRDTSTFESYPQVFQEKVGFLNNLSILDLIFNEGKFALDYLKNQKV